MAKTSAALNDFVAVLRDGILLYREAYNATDDEELRDLFLSMIDLREQTILKLAPIVWVEGLELRNMGTLVGQLREAMTKARALFGNTENAYLQSLFDLEEQTIKALEVCVKSAPDAFAKEVVATQKAAFQVAAAAVKARLPATDPH